jgi:hypothetical protein|tara:strand:+ start:3120 stop:3293 length:174 start_codon:yes stop_codon:yes gene_type:complete
MKNLSLNNEPIIRVTDTEVTELISKGYIYRSKVEYKAQCAGITVKEWLNRSKLEEEK